MKKSNKLGVFAIAVMVTALLITGIVYGANTKSSMHNMDNSTPVATSKDRNDFIALWKKALAESNLKQDQLTKLSADLTATAQKLSENYMGLTDYRNQKAKATGDTAAKLQKRVDLKESERDLIISQTEMSLKKYLNAEQLDLVMMAGFHNVSMAYTGDKHMNGMDMGKEGKLGEMATDLSKLAQKLNRNCDAVTLNLVIKNLGK
jgi:hypothetical protein